MAASSSAGQMATSGPEGPARVLAPAEESWAWKREAFNCA